MKKIIIIFIFILILLLSINFISYGKEIVYTVRAGDSLYKISRQYGTTIQKLKEDNDLSSDVIYIDQKLIIIIGDGEERIYTVRPGDSLYKISLKFDTTIAEIMDANGLSSSWIYVGDKLLIPGQENEESKEKNDEKEAGITLSGRVNIKNKTENTIISGDNTINTEMVSSLNINTGSPEYSSSEIIIKYRQVISEQSLVDFEKENNIQPVNVIESNKGRIVRYRLAEDQDLDKLIKRYEKKEDVEWIEPNYLYYPTAVPDDRYYNYHQWDYINMNLEAAWDVEQGDRSVTVAVLDTGVIMDHPDLDDQLLAGADLLGGKKSYPVSNYEITDNDPTDETTLIEGGSHGTHVAGVIGAETDNYSGIAGINWNVNILPVRVLTRKGGTSWDIAEGIYYALDQGADVINLSLGGNYYSNLQKEAVETAVEKGVTIVAAAGNEGNSSVYYPAAFDDVIAVGAVDKAGQKTAYSNYGPEVDIVAPGGGYGESIYSTWGYYEAGATTASYGGMIGTSMATPHISGVVALLKANGVEDREEIFSRLTNTALDLGDPGRDDYYGYGLVDAYAALLGHSLAKPVVFAAVEKDNKLDVKSKKVTVDSNEDYTLDDIKGEDIKIIGWRDVNNNGRVDKGDYYGESAKIDTNRGNISDLEIDIYYVTNRSIYVKD